MAGKNEEAVRCWVFTSWEKPLIDYEKHCSYIVWGVEYTQEKRIHYQGYVEFKTPKKLFQVKSLFKSKEIYTDKAYSNHYSNVTYCKKDGNFFEYGVTIVNNMLENAKTVVNWDELLAM